MLLECARVYKDVYAIAIKMYFQIISNDMIKKK